MKRGWGTCSTFRHGLYNFDLERTQNVNIHSTKLDAYAVKQSAPNLSFMCWVQLISMKDNFR